MNMYLLSESASEELLGLVVLNSPAIILEGILVMYISVGILRCMYSEKELENWGFGGAAIALAYSLISFACLMSYKSTLLYYVAIRLFNNADGVKSWGILIIGLCVVCAFLSLIVSTVAKASEDVI